MFGLKKRLCHHNADNIYTYRVGPTFHAGVSQLVLEPRFGNPILLYHGAGVVCGALKVATGAYPVVQRTAQISGMLGIQNGQVALQPLQLPTNSQ